MHAIHGDKLRGHLEAMILSTLEQGEAHGLEILHRLDAAGCGLLKLKEGSLYPALYRLESAGQVQAVWEEEQHGRRALGDESIGSRQAASANWARGGPSGSDLSKCWAESWERQHDARPRRTSLEVIDLEAIPSRWRK